MMMWFVLWTAEVSYFNSNLIGLVLCNADNNETTDNYLTKNNANGTERNQKNET